MGQYWMPLLREAKNKEYKDTAFNAHHFGNGAKLMEHSYVGNNFVNEVWSQLIDRPQKVYWFGDYTEPGDAKLTARQVAKFKRMLYKDKNKFYTIPFGSPAANDDIMLHYPILVNHTKKEYIDIRHLRDRLEDLFDYTVCPLPLLTATSNDRGCGDYYEGHPGYEDVGIWAGDLIEVLKDTSGIEGYTERKTIFKEENE